VSDQRKYLAFDIEIAQQVEGNDWLQFRPLGITCAATLLQDSDWGSEAWFRSRHRMSARDLCDLVDYLLEKTSEGYTILTWNGLGFDFDILAEESGRYEDCANLALNHVDMMFDFFCSNGFALGLNKAALGMGLEGKTEGMDGALAPDLWARGERDKVLEYVRQDARTTLDVALAVEEEKALYWTSSYGNLKTWYTDRWLTVQEAMALPFPDVSWMDNPWPRSKFYNWTTPIFN